MHRVAALVLGMALLAGVGACSSAGEKVGDKIGDQVAKEAIEGATGGDIEVTDEGMTLDLDDGEYSVKETDELPDGWPKDVLGVADGFAITNVVETKTPDGVSMVVTTEGEGDTGDVVDFYVEAFESNGVEVEVQNKSSDGGMVVGTRDDSTYQAMIGTESGDRVSVMLSVTVQEDAQG